MAFHKIWGCQHHTKNKSTTGTAFGGRPVLGGIHIDPVLKLEENASLYAAQGTHISVTCGGSSACWAVVVVTPHLATSS
ncbi:hypothetical protein MRX96_000368 [Rhipicephalus microplus]